MAKLTDKLKNPTAPLSQRKSTPVWKGPESDGVTFSQLSRFLCCRERFRLLVVEGLKPKPKFDSKIYYGNMWHVCEEALATDSGPEGLGTAKIVQDLTKYCMELCREFPFDKQDIDHWYHMCMHQFPEYIKFWQEHDDVKERTPLLQEQVFDVPYKLPSGRTVRLRGKWDSVDLIGKGKDAGIYLQENKTKSQIDNQKITRQLTGDFQSMIYVIALERFDWTKKFDVLDSKSPLSVFNKASIKGVRYNVIRRSAHKTAESMYKKMSEDIADDRGGEWFSRWKVEVSAKDIERFKQRTLDPILEQLCEWWECITFSKDDPFKAHYNCHDNHGIHFQASFGVYDVLKEGGSTDLDSYLESGSEVGLQRVTNLYPELE